MYISPAHISHTAPDDHPVKLGTAIGIKSMPDLVAPGKENDFAGFFDALTLPIIQASEPQKALAPEGDTSQTTLDTGGDLPETVVPVDETLSTGNQSGAGEDTQFKPIEQRLQMATGLISTQTVSQVRVPDNARTEGALSGTAAPQAVPTSHPNGQQHKPDNLPLNESRVGHSELGFAGMSMPQKNAGPQTDAPRPDSTLQKRDNLVRSGATTFNPGLNGPQHAHRTMPVRSPDTAPLPAQATAMQSVVQTDAVFRESVPSRNTGPSAQSSLGFPSGAQPGATHQQSPENAARPLMSPILSKDHHNTTLSLGTAPQGDRENFTSPSSLEKTQTRETLVSAPAQLQQTKPSPTGPTFSKKPSSIQESETHSRPAATSRDANTTSPLVAVLPSSQMQAAASPQAPLINPLLSGVNSSRTGPDPSKSGEPLSQLLSAVDGADPFAWEPSRFSAQTSSVQPAGRGDLNAHVMRQLVEVAQHAVGRPVEIAMSPHELGRVRMSIVTEDGKITVNILAERIETLDLMRRNIDQLSQSFRQIGYSEIDFAFGQGSHPGGNDSLDQQDSSSDPRIALDIAGHRDSDPAPSSPTQLSHSAANGIDIRL